VPGNKPGDGENLLYLFISWMGADLVNYLCTTGEEGEGERGDPPCSRLQMVDIDVSLGFVAHCNAAHFSTRALLNPLHSAS